MADAKELKNVQFRSSNTRNAAKKKKTNTAKKVEWNFPLVKKDYIWLLIGVGIVILGYILLATGITEDPAVPGGRWMNFWAVDVAPIVLVIGYLVVIPLALMQFFSRRSSKKNIIESDKNNADAK